MRVFVCLLCFFVLEMQGKYFFQCVWGEGAHQIRKPPKDSGNPLLQPAWLGSWYRGQTEVPECKSPGCREHLEHTWTYSHWLPSPKVWTMYSRRAEDHRHGERSTQGYTSQGRLYGTAYKDSQASQLPLSPRAALPLPRNLAEMQKIKKSPNSIFWRTYKRKESN